VEDLYRNWLSELLRWFSKIGPAAIMDYQGLTGYLADSTTLQGPKSKFLATFLGRRSTGNEMTTDILIDGLEELTNSMMAADLQSEIAEQIINNVLAQMFAMAFNELLLRKSYATWRRGIQIQFNLSQLEDWASRLRTSKQWVYGPPIPQTEPLIQAVKLLQLAKTATAEDLPIIIETCHRLSLVQIRKILSSYVPDEFEDGPVCPSLMRALALRCQQAELLNEDPSALMLMMQELHPDSVPLHLSIKPLSPSKTKLPPSLVPPTLWKLFMLTDSIRDGM
jgi:myosin-5